MRRAARVCRVLLALVATFILAAVALGQTETATISGRVTDSSGSVIRGASVLLQNANTGAMLQTKTNDAGIYLFPSVHPGIYNLSVKNEGFKTEDYVGLTANVQDHLEHNFRMTIGAASESVTVTAEAAKLNTQDATVSTVVDRNFAENLPMNGRSFQTLIELTPGVVLTASSYADSGQFSVNGQRADSNYWMVDGVSANIGIGVSSAAVPGNGLAGAVGGFSAQGGTNSLVSVDAMQEFRVLTSTYAPEFGRTPGGQISIVTRSGSNQFHGTLFEYLRNDRLDANDWFNTFVTPALPKAKERQNDFGGTFGGPIVKDRTFFFFSYEGLRLRLPFTALTTVPDLAARQNAIPAMQPYLNSYPLPNGPDNAATGIAQFNASYTDPATLDAYSLRIDHELGRRLSSFGRFNYSPSENTQRGRPASLSTLSPSKITIQTETLGATWLISPVVANDLRLNYSRVNAFGFSFLDDFGGAVPLTSLPLPSPFTSQDSQFRFFITTLKQGSERVGKALRNLQRQINIVDSISLQESSHSLKLGVDYRRLSPEYDPQTYSQATFFTSMKNAKNGIPLFTGIFPNAGATFVFQNLGVYAEDTWELNPRLIATYGVRWDVDFAPKSRNGPDFNAVTGFDLNDLSQLALAPAGTPPFKTAYGNVAPRVGVAYQLRQSQDWQTVVRGGYGVFYDLATSEMGNQISGAYPFGGSKLVFGGTFPLGAAAAAPPAITPPNNARGSVLFAVDPNLRLPYTRHWAFAIEQALGRQQTLSAAYIGAAGRRLLQSAEILSPNPSLYQANLLTNAGTSDYDALQLQFQRRLSRGLQVLASYTWSHSLDTASAGSYLVGSNLLGPGNNPKGNRGPSDFDVRHAFSAAITYDVPAPRGSSFARAILGGWSTENIFQAQTARPVDIFAPDVLNSYFVSVHPDLVPGQPLYLYGPQYPGGKAFNASAFSNPPVDSSTGNSLRQGNVPRNFLRGFGFTQWDFAIHRWFPIREYLQLQFRAEVFNVLNHPNFGPPSGAFGAGGFGVATQMLGRSFVSNGGANAGGLSPLYQVGGPRSIQLGLKLTF